MSDFQIKLDQLSAERVGSDESTDKVVTPSATQLRADGCAAELWPYGIPPCYAFRKPLRPTGASGP